MGRIALASIIVLTPLHFVQASNLIDEISVTSYIGDTDTRTMLEGQLDGLTLYTTTEQGCDPTDDLYLCENQNSYTLTGTEYEISDPYTTSDRPGYYTLVTSSDEKSIEIINKESNHLQPINRAEVVLNDGRLYVKSKFTDGAYSKLYLDRYVSSTNDMQEWVDVEGWNSDFTGGGKNLFFALNSEVYSVSLHDTNNPSGCRAKLYQLENNEWVLTGNEVNQIAACYITDPVVLNDTVYGIGKPGYGTPASVEVWSSSNGSAWSNIGDIPEAVPNTKPDIKYSSRLILHDNSMLFTGGVSEGVRKIWKSSDGIEWILWGETPSLQNIEQASIHSGDGQLIMLIPGVNGDLELWETTDGMSWTEIALDTFIPSRFGATLTEYNDEFFIIGGWDGDYGAANPIEVDYIWKSKDLISWTAESREPFTPSSNRQEINYYDGKFVHYSSYATFSHGFSGTWTSDNGVDWIRESTSSITDILNYPTFIEFDSKLFGFGDLISTTTGQSYSSEDGINWVLENPELPFNPGLSGSFTVHNGSLWATTGNMRFQVWNSQDGVNWSLVYESDNLVNATGYRLVSWNGRLWVLGGAYAYAEGNWDRIYYSYTGRYWYRSSSTADFSQRSRPNIFEYDGRLRSVGGQWASGGIATDIWESDNARDWELVGSSSVGNSVITHGNDIFLTTEYAHGDFKNRIRTSSNGYDWRVPVKQVVFIENSVVSVRVVDSSDTSVLDVFELEVGGNLIFDLSAYSASNIDSVAGSCSGTLSGTEYAIPNVSESCEVTVTYEESSWWSWW